MARNTVVRKKQATKKVDFDEVDVTTTGSTKGDMTATYRFHKITWQTALFNVLADDKNQQRGIKSSLKLDGLLEFDLHEAHDAILQAVFGIFDEIGEHQPNTLRNNGHAADFSIDEKTGDLIITAVMDD